MTNKTILVRIDSDEPPLDALRKAKMPVPGWCGGTGICGLCRVRICAGDKPVPSERDRALLSMEELQSGWRLACQLPAGTYILERLVDEPKRVVTEPPSAIIGQTMWPGRPGPGIALDLGTTTVMATEIDERGEPGLVSVAKNRQALFGDNVIDRLSAARDAGHRQALQNLALKSLGAVVGMGRERGELWVSIVGNTAMHHLLAGLDVLSLSTAPYVPAEDGFAWREIALSAGSDGRVITAVLVPPLGGFVGSDALASVALIERRFSEYVWMLIDIGTNCEVVLGLGGHIFYSSAPAGPAFEGGHLSSGMLAGRGAVNSIIERDESISWSMIGDGKPVGLSGTAVIDYVAVLRRLGHLGESGRFVGSRRYAALPGAEHVGLSQLDIREVQKAKAAVEFCVRGVLRAAGVGTLDLEVLAVAGGFGNGLDIENAREIGLLPSLHHDRFILGGNLALLGAGFVLEKKTVEDIRRRSRRIVMHGDESGERYAAALALRPWKQ